MPARVSDPNVAPHPSLEYTHLIRSGGIEGYRALPRVVGRAGRLTENYDRDQQVRSIQPPPRDQVNFQRARFAETARPSSSPAPLSPTSLAEYATRPLYPVRDHGDDGIDYSKHYLDTSTNPSANYNRNSTTTQQFFTNGQGRFVSDNGTANAHLYYRTTRPFGARLRPHYASKTTAPGYHFDCY